MGIELFKIVYDNESRKYKAGSTVTGQLLIKQSGNESTNAITLRIYGMARTRWKDTYIVSRASGKNGTVSNYTEDIYEGQQTFFEMSKQVFGDGKNWEQFPSDEIVFPFSFKIPEIFLPGNVVLSDGSIVYGIEAVMKTVWYKLDLQTFSPFTIAPPPLNLNDVPGSEVPIDQHIEQSFGFWVNSQPLQIIVEVSRRGVCPGETIPIVVQIFNLSDQRILNVSAAFVQKWTMFGWSGSCLKKKIESRLFNKTIMDEGVQTQTPEAIVWQTKLTIPNVVSSTPVEASNVIKMEYFIHIEAVAEGGGECCGDGYVVQRVPIIVGKSPLNQSPTISEHSSLYEGIGCGM